MIQFNLLPDVKLEYIRTRRSKHMMLLASIAVSATALAVFVLLFVVVNVVQKKHLNDLNKDVTKLSSELKATPNLDKILTVQNQLDKLPALHSQKPVASRLFSYLGQITPAQVSIAKLDVNFAGSGGLTSSTMIITGAADSINSVNTFIDTIKFTTYHSGDANDSKKAFSDVVLSTFGREDKGASYTINLKFDPLIFDKNTNVVLTVPKQVTTRSETEKPSDLFQPNSNTRIQ